MTDTAQNMRVAVMASWAVCLVSGCDISGNPGAPMVNSLEYPMVHFSGSGETINSAVGDAPDALNEMFFDMPDGKRYAYSAITETVLQDMKFDKWVAPTGHTVYNSHVLNDFVTSNGAVIGFAIRSKGIGIAASENGKSIQIPTTRKDIIEVFGRPISESRNVNTGIPDTKKKVPLSK